MKPVPGTSFKTTLEDDRIVEGQDWGQVDWLGLFRQLDVLPDPPH